MRPNLQPCYCGRVTKNKIVQFDQCCRRYLDHFETMPAPDAESLMRSRYSAFVLERGDYLKKTWLDTTCPSDLSFEPDVKWLGLQVKRYGLTGPAQAEVEFVALSRLKGQPTRLHELSRFLKDNGRWFYVDDLLRLPQPPGHVKLKIIVA
jgi:SEC-C motif-containing protein